jgi:hypothetical protein
MISTIMFRSFVPTGSCATEERVLSPKTQTNLKNAKSYFEEHLAIGDYYTEAEQVSVRKIHGSGKIALQDGRILPADYRQFARGYAVTSYGSQGKTVDHVLLSDSAVRAATNAQQWYVTISRGRKSVQIFTPDKQQLRRAITRSGDRELALKLVTPARVNRIGQQTRAVRRGRDFARQVCQRAMRSWFAMFLKTNRKQLHETSSRNKQASGVRGTRVLAP